jgi:hypothetical protein
MLSSGMLHSTHDHHNLTHIQSYNQLITSTLPVTQKRTGYSKQLYSEISQLQLAENINRLFGYNTYYGLRITRMALSNQSELPAFFSPQQVNLKAPTPFYQTQ